jgi:hypothetical protein
VEDIMARSEVHPIPIVEGGKSVLSDKKSIKGLPKAKKSPSEGRDPASCENVLAGPQCIKGIKEPKQKRK